jgi:hypothetical protein
VPEYHSETEMQRFPIFLSTPRKLCIRFLKQLLVELQNVDIYKELVTVPTLPFVEVLQCDTCILHFY